MGRGGVRKGAGRPAGSGRFREKTKAIRVPIGSVDKVYRSLEEIQKFPLYDAAVRAGFPSSADGSVDQELSLNELLVRHPTATFFVRVCGDSMTGAGIYHDDLLMVDKSLEATSGKIVIAAVNGELTVKRLQRENGVVYLVAENPAYKPILLEESMDVRVWGVVTAVIHMM